MNNQKLEYALKYASLGLHVFPCHSIRNTKCSCSKDQCDKKGKHPRTPNGFKDATMDVDTIKKYWTQYPDANIGCATGEISQVDAIDLDTKQGKSVKEMLNEMSKHGFNITATVCSETGQYLESKERGTHFLVKHVKSIYSKSDILKEYGIKGVDIRADNGYIILPPSNHLTGVNYEWQIEPTGIGKIDNLADMPESFKKLLLNNTSEKKWLAGKDGVSEGSRNETSASMAGKILSSTVPELWESIGWDQLKVWNSKNTPPLSEKELRNTWESLAKKFNKNDQFQKGNYSKINVKGKAVTRCFSDIQSVPITWLWEGRIAIGKLTMIAGDPGLGKSFVTVNLATNVSRSLPFPVDNSRPPIGDVIFLSAEDDPADTIKPRLEAMGADCNRIHIIEAIQEEVEIENEPTPQRMFSFKHDIEKLSDLLSTLPNCNLVIIDPISAYLDSADSNNNSDIRGLLAPLSVLAGKHKVAIVLVSHLNKNSSGNSAYRVMGSLAFTAAVRTAYIVTKDKENPERRLVMPLKNNIAKDTTGLAYFIVEGENGMPIIAWETEPVQITLEEALASVDSKEERTATDEAIDFLLVLLAKGPVRADEAEKEAKQVGIKVKPLRTAREKLKITTKKRGFNPTCWVWELPEDAQRTEVAQSDIVGNFDVAGRLRGSKFEKLDDFVDDLKRHENEVEENKTEIIPEKLKNQPVQEKLPPF